MKRQTTTTPEFFQGLEKHRNGFSKVWKILSIGLLGTYSVFAAPVTPIRLPGDTGFTLTAKVVGVPADGDVKLAGETAADGGPRWRLAVEGTGENRRLVFEIRVNVEPEVVKEVQQRLNKIHSVTPQVAADAQAGLVRVTAPLRVIGGGPHTIMVRLTPPVWNLVVFVDGVLLDEDWPLGAMVAGGQICVPDRMLTEFSVEPCTVTDEQIVARNGGKVAVTARAEKFFGLDVNVPPFFRPRGINMHTGDCAPIFDGVRWHLFYLKDRDHWQRRWGWGGLSYAHISSADLVHWEEHPDAIKIRHPYEGAVWTGSFAKIGDEYYGFVNNWLIPQRISPYKTAWGVRTYRSHDGIHFSGPEGDKPIPGMDGGDSDIFAMDDGGYGMLSRGDRQGQRQIFFYTSPDLKNWTEEKSPFAFAPVNCDCPHYFRFADGHYLFSSMIARKAESFRGPWQDMPPSALGVPKTAPWKDDRRIIVGMVGDGGWGGDGVFHELIKLPDGHLGEKFVPEMTPLRGTVLERKPVAMIGKSVITGTTVTVRSSGAFAAAAVDGIPPLARIRLTARLSAGCRTFGLTFRGKAVYGGGISLVLNPAEKTAAFCHVAGVGKHVASGVSTQIGIKQPVTFDAILGPEGLVDVEMNGQQCTVLRGTKDPTFNRLFLFADGGDVTFENIQIRPWTPSNTMER